MADKLTDYRRKRDAGETPEPVGDEHAQAAGKTRAGAFVVHLHDATRTHYDLRIETSGVLASFAIPKGPALDPNDKQLAVRTEDHPIEYLDFEAVIPKGQYGAGPMICWDRGAIRYLESSVEEGLAAGKIDFTLSGYKLRGRFALVKLAKSEKGNEWLLIKKADAHATTDDPRVLQPRSVLSGLTVGELERAPAMMAEAEALAKGLGAKLGELDGRALSPMLCASLEDRSATTLPPWLEADYTYELKLDGVRVIADKRGDDVFLTYRSNRDTTEAYPEVARAVQTLAPARVVLDGEIVAFDEKGLPNFQRLAQRIHASERTSRWATLGVPVVYLVFDVLALGPYDLRGLPLVCRREILRKIVLGSGVIRALDFLETGGNALLEFCRARQMEGIVAKRADSPYRAGPKRTNDWVKVKCERDESFVVIGWTRGNEGRSRLGALDLGSFEDGELVVRGKVGSGLDEKTIDLLLEKLGPLVTQEKKFRGPLDAAPNGRTFVEPKIVVSVRYLGWSDDGRLRFPTFRGIDYDRAPADCTTGPSPEEPSAQSVRSPPSRRAESLRVVLSNQDKVFWPKEGITKGDVCRYYEKISNVLLPHLHDRPAVLVRYPDGVEGKNFFQWNVPFGFPAWIRHIPLGTDDEDKKKRVFLINDLEALLAVANLGAIPMHVLACRVGALEHCDFCTIDFDVAASAKRSGATDDERRSTLKNGVTLALELRELLERIGLRGFPKTSGQRGLHVIVPLGPGVPFDAAQALNTLLGRLVTARHPEIATMERVVERRGPRVLVDIGQTGRRRTIVAPYSVRAFPGATVSTPLAWDEVNESLDPSRFTIATVPERIARIGDLARGVLDEKPDVAAAVAALGALVR